MAEQTLQSPVKVITSASAQGGDLAQKLESSLTKGQIALYDYDGRRRIYGKVSDDSSVVMLSTEPKKYSFEKVNGLLETGDTSANVEAALTGIDSASAVVPKAGDLLVTADDVVVTGVIVSDETASFSYLYNETLYTVEVAHDDTDGWSAEVTAVPISGGESSYSPSEALADMDTPNAVGGIAAGTAASELAGKTFSQLFDDLLFPTINPTFKAPTLSMSLSGYSSLVKVGAAGPTKSNFTHTYNPGSIMLNGVKQANRGGAEVAESFVISINGSDSSTVSAESSPATMPEGTTTYRGKVSYEQGPQPKDNKGNNYSTPLAAGSVQSGNVTINATWPWFATTANNTTLTEQALISWNGSAGSMVTPRFALQPSGGGKQEFKLPRKLTELQMLNTVSQQMEVIPTTDYTESQEDTSVNSVNRQYYVYTYNGAARGSVTLLAKF